MAAERTLSDEFNEALGTDVLEALSDHVYALGHLYAPHTEQNIKDHYEEKAQEAHARLQALINGNVVAAVTAAAQFAGDDEMHDMLTTGKELIERMRIDPNISVPMNDGGRGVVLLSFRDHPEEGNTYLAAVENALSTYEHQTFTGDRYFDGKQVTPNERLSQEAINAETIMAYFRITGIYPPSRSQIDDTIQAHRKQTEPLQRALTGTQRGFPIRRVSY